MDAADFWRERLRTNGHTGWSDPVIYAFDQLERLRLVRGWLVENGIRGDWALDFGCGTGDFSKLLLSFGFKVVGYDPFVRPAIRNTRFVYADSYTALAQLVVADLALSITTLDHLLKTEEAHEALTKIRSTLRDGGLLCMLEYALDDSADRHTFNLKNDYQSFRSLGDWEYLMQTTGFRIRSVCPVPHPLVQPSAEYREYAHSFLVRLRRRFPRLPLTRQWYDKLLGWHAAKILGRTRLQTSAGVQSLLKFIICEAV
jgi:SAM-dependent methyltransferase